ncbi:FAD-linked oxidoreductase [Ascobolus immersus RN42]|uniref:Proline dehydrogenase n=1 Tax=Ascobolus immersus RN42 TaxID=1160509 RepID=A0A3N4IQ98_ASCIM|nr:FAD-linked oxidoreductase [Ascobolus immersus RN42]
MRARVIRLRRPIAPLVHRRAASTAFGRHPELEHKPIHEDTEINTEAGKIPVLRSPCPLDIRPLDKFSNAELLRGLLMHSVSASPPLTTTASAVIMGLEKHLEKPSLSVVKTLIDSTFYNHYCLGDTAEQISRTIDGLRQKGIAGVILSYAKEVTPAEATESTEFNDIQTWVKGNMRGIGHARPGDYIALKLSGAGISALRLLKRPDSKLNEHQELERAVHETCNAARNKGVRILIDAEQQSLQSSVDSWVMELMAKYNKPSEMRDGTPLLSNTYQAYRIVCPDLLKEHLKIAKERGFVLGIKLVRGAYRSTEPYGIWGTKEATDNCYDGILNHLLCGDSYAKEGGLYSVMIATHNRQSVELAQNMIQVTRSGLGTRPANLTSVTFAQLQGMADELSMGLIKAAAKDGSQDAPKVYKYAAFGTTRECIKYLMRRAQENVDASARSKENRDAVLQEIKHRVIRD